MATSTICSFDKFGFCKYGVRCRKKHADLRCEDKSCEIFNCNKRHPKQCRYYKEFKRCKYNEYCRFDHKENAEGQRSDKMLETRLLNIETLLQEVQKNYNILTEKLLEKDEKIKDIENQVKVLVDNFSENTATSKILASTFNSPTTTLPNSDSITKQSQLAYFST